MIEREWKTVSIALEKVIQEKYVLLGSPDAIDARRQCIGVEGRPARGREERQTNCRWWVTQEQDDVEAQGLFLGSLSLSQ